MGGQHEYFGWGIELDDYDRRFVVGIGYSPTLTGKVADWSNVVTTLVFKTRKQAREALSRFRVSNAGYFLGKPIRAGGNRIYRSGRVVHLTITVAVSEP